MADSSAKKEESWSLQSHDGPCSNCRVRKIKCGREKPECSICRQAQVDCIYTPPPKRVNHVKVLCESFDEVNDRLNMVQAQLSALTSMLESSKATVPRSLPQKDTPNSIRPEHNRRASCPTLPDNDLGDRVPPGGFVIREEGTLNERYYGPWTLDAECRDFNRDVSSSSISTMPDLVRGFQRALESTPVDLPSPPIRQGQNSERLLPKVFLSVMVEHFVSQADFCTDIFLRKTLDSAVDRAYSDSRDAHHEPWAVCLDLIFLFVLGAEQPLRAADHTQPLFDAVDSAISKQQLFMAPRLIAVQTLALLSLIAPSYYPESISDVLFAQACHMATLMGLHCHDLIAPGQMDLDLSVDEIIERRKLFRSLYIRERCYATARGTLRRLPRYLPDASSRTSSRAMSHDASSTTLAISRGESPLTPVNYDETNEPLFNLAMIQDELHAALVPGTSPEEQRMVLASIRQKLLTFAQTHRMPSMRRPETFQDLSTHLAYLGTRIRAYEVNLTADDQKEVLDDARLSCLLVVSACSGDTGLESAAAETLDGLLRLMARRNWCTTDTPVSPRSPGGSGISSGVLSAEAEGYLRSPRAPNKRFWPFGAESLASSNTTTLQAQRILELMPTSAIFILARNILGIYKKAGLSHLPSATTPEKPAADKSSDNELLAHPEGDFFILGALARSLESSLGVSNEAQNNYSSKLLRVVRTLVNFIREAGDLLDQQECGPSEMRQKVTELNGYTEATQDGGLGSSTNLSATEASFMNLSASWESSPGPGSLGPGSLPFPFSPSFDLSSMNISNVADSLFDFDFSQHFDSAGGFVSPAEQLADPEALKISSEQDVRKKRLRLDCSQELNCPGDMLSTWPPRNRATMARGSV